MIGRVRAAASGYLDPLSMLLSLNVDSVLETSDPESALVQISLVAETAYGPPGKAHVEHVSSLPDAETRANAVVSFTAFCHESRHYHDLLLTCYGSFLMRQSLQLLMGYFSHARDPILLKCPIIYVPVTTWMSDHQVLRFKYPDLPKVPSQLAEYVQEAERIQQTMRDLDLGSIARQFPGLTSASLLEGSAMLVQEEQVRESFGIPAVPEFWSLFSDAGQALYHGARTAVSCVLGSELPLDLMSMLFFAAMCSDYRSQESGAVAPIDVFLLLLAELHRCEDRSSRHAVEGAIRRVFSANDWGSPLEAVTRAHQENKSLLAMYQSGHDPGRVHESVTKSLSAFSNYVEIQALLIERFAEDPWEYYDCRRYVKALYDLPLPLVALECSKGLPFDTTRSIPGVSLESGLSFAKDDLLSTLSAGEAAQYAPTLASIAAPDGTVTLWQRLLLRGNCSFPVTLAQEDWAELLRWSEGVRFLLDSDTDRLADHLVANQLAYFSAVGVKVLALGGPLSTSARLRR